MIDIKHKVVCISGSMLSFTKGKSYEVVELIDWYNKESIFGLGELVDTDTDISPQFKYFDMEMSLGDVKIVIIDDYGERKIVNDHYYGFKVDKSHYRQQKINELL